MPDVLDLVGGVLVVLGSLATLLGAVGVWRFPDIYTRLHAASITDTGGATLVLLGLALISGLTLVTLKLAICWLVLMIAGPTAAHALAAAAYSSGVPTWRRPDGENKQSPASEKARTR